MMARFPDESEKPEEVTGGHSVCGGTTTPSSGTDEGDVDGFIGALVDSWHGESGEGGGSDKATGACKN